MSETSDSRAAVTVGAGILLSRILGLLRITFFAHYFGTSSTADAFNAAGKIPNAIRNLLGEGTLSAAFVPAYSRMLARADRKTSRAMASALLGILLVSLSLLTILGIVFAPLLTQLAAPGWDAPQRALTTQLTRVLFPMTGLMVLSGWCLGIQNSHRRFFWSYASAALWSMAQIGLLWGWGAHARDLAQLAWWLAWATLLGAALQVAAQLPEVMRLLGPIRPTLDRAAEGVLPMLRNVVPVVTALGVVQISSFIDLQIATFLPTGAVANLSYANLLVLLPVSIFGVSVAASSLPDLSRDSGAMDIDALLERLRGGWQRVLFYIVPSAVVCVVFGDYCVGIIYRTGAFGPSQQREVHAVLAAFAVGLVSFGSVKLLSSVYYALQDYRTPLRSSIVSISVSAVASIVLAYPLRHTAYGAAAIALGTALGSYVNLSLLVRGLHRRLGPLYTTTMWIGTRRIVLASLVGTMLALAMRVAQTSQWPNAHPRLVGPPILIAFSVAYLVSAWWMGSREAARWLRRAPRTAFYGD